MVTNWSEFAAELIRSEGEIPHMYLDTGGLVTVGVGNLLPDVAAAQRLPFVERGTASPATAEAIAADFTAVRQQPKGRLAAAYRLHTRLDLPLPAQFALVDLAFNLGTQGLLGKFPKLLRAVAAGDFATAAAESARRQVSAGRNALVHDWLAAAGRAQSGS